MIETKRLLLRKFTLDDAKAVLEFSSNPQVTQYTGDAHDVLSLSDAQDVIRNIWLKEYEGVGYARFALVEKQSKKVIGFSGLKFLPEFNLADLGYRMLPEYWGRGYATESAKASIDYARDILKLKTVMAMVMPANIASEKVLRKLGFTPNGFTKIDQHNVKLFKLDF